MLRGFDRVICINDGELAYDGNPDEAIAFYTELMEQTS